MKAVIYMRVSTKEQTTDNQLLDLEKVIALKKWQVVGKPLIDHGISGAKGRDKRPALDKALLMCAKRECDILVVWALDRLGRSLQDLLNILNELHAAKCELYIHNQGIDTTTPSGKAMFAMLGVFAEFERSMICERVKAGLARAATEGHFPGRPKVLPEVEDQIRSMRNAGRGMHWIARELGVGTGTVQRIVKEMA